MKTSIKKSSVRQAKPSLKKVKNDDTKDKDGDTKMSEVVVDEKHVDKVGDGDVNGEDVDILDKKKIITS